MDFKRKVIEDYVRAVMKLVPELQKRRTEAEEALAKGMSPRLPMLQQQLPADPLHLYTHLPSAVFNVMLHPITSCSIRGLIWYQGEQDSSVAEQYRTSFPTLIRDWRKRFGNPELPFLYVQLCTINAPPEQPPERSQWAELRETQAACLDVPHTAMAVTVDLDESEDRTRYSDRVERSGHKARRRSLGLGRHAALQPLQQRRATGRAVSNASVVAIDGTESRVVDCQFGRLDTLPFGVQRSHGGGDGSGREESALGGHGIATGKEKFLDRAIQSGEAGVEIRRIAHDDSCCVGLAVSPGAHGETELAHVTGHQHVRDAQAVHMLEAVSHGRLSAATTVFPVVARGGLARN
jgi:hypothetical protein